LRLHSSRLRHLDRKAASGIVAYHDGEFVDGHLKSEARLESLQDHARDHNSFLLQTGFNVKAWDDWHLTANLDAAIYRQMGDNFKIGVGYNFGHFSDDLRSIGVDDHGVFVNAIGKF
jgi:hypothetical protein